MKGDEEGRVKPEGGYCVISVGALLRSWEKYRKGEIEYQDLRVWLASHELAARRCGAKKGRKLRYRPDELSGLLGGGGKDFRASLRRLEAHKLISWESSAITFPGPEAATRSERRPVPVPRRTLRFLSACKRPTVLATALGHLVRCLYLRGGKCYPRGTCKASWVSRTFSVDERSVKAARRHLADIGWLFLSESPHWHRQRFGSTAVINLTWRGPMPPKSPPRPPGFRARISPPESDKKLPLGSRNQKPGAAEQPGLLREGEREPSLSDVRPEDLLSFARTEALYRQAVQRGWVRHSESEALNWVGAAVRAKSVRGDPVRVFLGIVRKRLWHHITNEQEERARSAMSRYHELNPRLFRPPESLKTPGSLHRGKVSHRGG